jgi:hypothetical protein
LGNTWGTAAKSAKKTVSDYFPPLSAALVDSRSFAKHAAPVFFPHFVGDFLGAVIPDRIDRGSGLLKQFPDRLVIVGLGGSGRYRSCRILVRVRSPLWLKVKNPNAPAVRREADEDWGH